MFTPLYILFSYLLLYFKNIYKNQNLSTNMLNKTELLNVLLVLISLSLAFLFVKGAQEMIPIILFLLIVIIVNILGKKLTAYFLHANINTRIWHFYRFWFFEKSHLKKPFPIGFFLPLVSSLLSIGYFVWFAVLEFDAVPLKSRISKSIGLYRFTELTEFHIGLIAAFGIIFNLVLAVLAYLLDYSFLARLSIYYASFNLLPMSNLDGTKIFFASKNGILWFILSAICAIFLVYSIFAI